MHVGWCRISSINRTKGYRDWPTFPVPKKKRRHRILNPSEIPAFTVCSDLPNHHRLPGSNHSEITMLWVPKRKHQQKKEKLTYSLKLWYLWFFVQLLFGVFLCAARMHASQLAQRSGDAAHHIGKSNQGKNHLAVGWLLLLVVVATMFLHQPKNSWRKRSQEWFQCSHNWKKVSYGPKVLRGRVTWAVAMALWIIRSKLARNPTTSDIPREFSTALVAFSSTIEKVVPFPRTFLDPNRFFQGTTAMVKVLSDMFCGLKSISQGWGKVLVVYPAPRMPVTNGGVGLGFPTKHGIILWVGGSSNVYVVSTQPKLTARS